jgi:large subunit ribosomal protein L24
MQKFHIKRGDIVVVIAGAHKGKQGKVLELLAAKRRARVEGVAMIKRHLKKSQDHPQGTIAEREGSIHVSNLMSLARWEQTKAAKKEPAPQSGPTPQA